MEKKSARVFEQEWILDPTNTIRTYPKGYSKNADFDFSKYCKNFYMDLLKLKKYNENEFNAISTKTIDEYIGLYNKIFETFFDTVIDDIKFKNTSPMLRYDEDKPYSQWNKETRFDFLEFCFHKDFLKSGVFEIFEPAYLPAINAYMPTTMRFSDYIYPRIKKITDMMFELEEVIAQTSKKLWQNAVLNNLNNFNKDSNYGLFIKVINDWRKGKDNADVSSFTAKRFTTSVSYITNSKSRFFRQILNPCELVGLVYSDEGFICGQEQDVYLEEYIDNECPYEEKCNYSKVMRIAKYGKHDVYSLATKICTPRCTLNYLNDYNEIVLDTRKSKPIGIFYVSKINGTDVNVNNQAYNLARRLSIKFRLPIIELESKNTLKDDELFCIPQKELTNISSVL